VVLPRIKNDLVSLLIATAKGQLSNMSLQTDLRFATTIVAVSAGYPNAYKKGIVIDGLPTNIEDTILFHSGTVLSEDKVVTNGGRVLCATALADDVKTAISKSQALVKAVQFDGKYFRTDIGFEFTSSVPS
jgi:phosphoribosylamine--glycine ligase